MDKLQKNKTEIEIDAFKVLACKNKELESFINVFHFKKENLAESQLGELFGIIKVFDHSEQSAYIPNLIARVIKKEFYSNTKISAEKAFENALKKANIALSDLARHEIVNWMEKFHAVVGIIQNDNFFFTQAGGGKIILLRNDKIDDISHEFGKSDTEHPIKTFSDISSGSLFVNDKIIFATESLLESLSWENLKRHAKTFNSSEFDNLVKSTLELEGENVGIVVANIKEKVIVPIATLPKTKPSKAYNFFGNEKVEKEKKESEKASGKEETAERKIVSDKGKESEEGEEKKQRGEENDESLSPFDQQPELYIKESDPIDSEHQKQPANIFGKFKEAIRQTKSSKRNEDKIVKSSEEKAKEDIKKSGDAKIARFSEKEKINTGVTKEDNSAAGRTILLPDNGNLIKDKKNDKRSKTAERLYRVATVQEPEQKELSSLPEKHKKELNRDTDVFHKQITKKDAGQAKKNGLKQVKAELKRDFEKLIAKTAKKKWFTKLLP
ncbi:MAG: hypothetical protein U9M90_02165, partial [Patescibacteria group bacterium]|nr:hypothetical protein [Patescibacteria group bacterium]